MLLEVVRELRPAVAVKLMKCVKTLTWEPSALELVGAAGTVRILLDVLRQESGPHVTDMHNQALNSLFNYCRLSRERQEEAAVAGAASVLRHFAVMKQSPLRQLALPVLCDMAHASSRSRDAMWSANGVQLLVEQLEDRNWQPNILAALATWLADDTARVEPVLMQTRSVECVLDAFAAARSPSLDRILEPLQRLLYASELIARALAMHQPCGLAEAACNRLQHPKAATRVALLKIIMTLHAAHPRPHQLATEHSMMAVVRRLANQDPSILVQELASKLLAALEQSRLVAAVGLQLGAASAPAGSHKQETAV